MKNFSWSLIFLLCFSVACERVQDEVAGQDKKLGGSAEFLKQPSPIAEGVAQLSAATVLIKSTEQDHYFTVEVVDSEEAREQGLQGRESLGVNNGMWFIFASEVQEQFWMKDTFIPLDIIFVGADMTIVDIIANTVPESTELLSSADPYQYVLEVNAGTLEHKLIQVGDQVEFRVGPK